MRLLLGFRWVHRWIGLVIAVPLLLEGVSGAYLVAAEALEDWCAPALRTPCYGGDAAAILAAAGRAGHNGLVPARYLAPEGRRPAVVDLAKPDGRATAARLWIDPDSLSVLAVEANPEGVARWMRQFHENLFLPFGRSIVGWAGVGMLAMTVTGLLLWWPPRGRRLAALGVSRQARGMRLARELHGAVAIWLFVPLLFQSVSGIPLSFPATTRTLAGLAPTQRMMARGDSPQHPDVQHPGAQRLDIAAITARAEAALPGARLAELRLPTAPGRPVFARYRRPDEAEGTPRPFAMIAVDGSRVISVEDPARSPATWLLGWNRVLHGMEAGGPAWHALQFLSGLALPLLAITGALLWAVRRIRRARQLSRTAAAAE